jgi:hypothetical protein
MLPGYWILDETGHVTSFGAARHYGEMAESQRAPGEKAVSLGAIPGGDGYWIFTDTGRVRPNRRGRRHVVGELVAGATEVASSDVVLPVLSSGELAATPLHSDSWPAVDVALLMEKEALVIPPGFSA